MDKNQIENANLLGKEFADAISEHNMKAATTFHDELVKLGHESPGLQTDALRAATDELVSRGVIPSNSDVISLPANSDVLFATGGVSTNPAAGQDVERGRRSNYQLIDKAGNALDGQLANVRRFEELERAMRRVEHYFGLGRSLPGQAWSDGNYIIGRPDGTITGAAHPPVLTQLDVTARANK